MKKWNSLKQLWKMNEIIYKDNKIVCFSSNDFQAFVMNQDGDIESGTFSTLSALKNG